MTAILFDGFDHVDEDHRWTNMGVHGASTSQVRTGTHSLGVSAGGSTYLAMNSSEEDDVMYMGFGFFNNDNGLKISMVTFSEGFGTTNHLSLIRDGPVRGWELRRGTNPTWPAAGGAGTVLVASQPNMWFPNSWHYIELGLKIHNTDGWFELRQDGVTRLRFDGDTNNAGVDGLIDMVSWGNNTNAGLYWVDDVYILNEQGSVNNSWLGDTRCYPLYPNGDGTSSTPLSGSDGNTVNNWQLVDEPGAPVLTDYVFSQTDGDQDTYTFQDLPVTLGTIRGVEVRIHAAKDETGTKQIRAITRRLGTDSFGPDHTLAAIPLYQTHHDIQELDPHAGPGAWTISTINDTEWGVEVRP